VLKGKTLVKLLSIFMTLFQHDGSRQYGNAMNTIERFLSFINQGNDSITLEGINHVPQAVNNKTNILALGAWEFDITKIIHPTATIYEILAGWNTLVAERIPMDSLFLSLFIRDVSDLLASKVHLIGFKGNKEELKKYSENKNSKDYSDLIDMIVNSLVSRGFVKHANNPA
jgi:hypothetical protein